MKFIVIKTTDYKQQVNKLPNSIKKILIRQEEFLDKDIFHSRLHTKKLKGFEPDLVYSFRISRSYRGIFRLGEKGVILFAIGHRKDIYR